MVFCVEKRWKMWGKFSKIPSNENLSKMWIRCGEKFPENIERERLFHNFHIPYYYYPYLYIFFLFRSAESRQAARPSLVSDFLLFFFLKNRRGKRKKRERKNSWKTKRKSRQKRKRKNIPRARKTGPAWASVNCLLSRSYNAQNRISRFGTFVGVGAPYNWGTRFCPDGSFFWKKKHMAGEMRFAHEFSLEFRMKN